MPRLTILSLASACVLAASPVLAQSAPTTTTPAPQPAATTPDTSATPAKPASGSGCGWKARQVMS